MALRQNEIRDLLKNVPAKQCAAFALRAAMRVLPVLGRPYTLNKKILGIKVSQTVEWFGFWSKDDRAKHLFSTFRACALNVELLYNRQAGAYAAADAAYAAAYAADDAYAAAGAAGAYAAAYAAYAAADAYAADAYAADAYAAAAYAAADADANLLSSFHRALEQDLSLLEKQPSFVLWTTPLWHAEPTPFLQNDFVTACQSLDAGFEVWLAWYEVVSQGRQPDFWLSDVPAEILARVPADINAYLSNLANKSANQSLNRVRAIFIGYGEAGKTSLVQVLNGRSVTQGDGVMTPGIDITDWKVPDSDLQAIFWDFGGQVMAHATHQFFLRANCLYVVVLNARGEINATEQAEYWLEHVKGFGANAPVMIVGNKSDLAPLNLDMGYLKGKYPSIVDYYPLSCTQAFAGKQAEFERFRSVFCAQLREVGKLQMKFTQEQFQVLNALRQQAATQDFLTHQAYKQLCERYAIPKDGVLNQDNLLDLLDKLGVVIHFPQLPRLGAYVLNPAWLTHGVYTLIYARQAKLTEKQVINVLQDQTKLDECGNAYHYPSDKCCFIMDAMQQFKLSYRLSKQPDMMIIPELLATDLPQNIPFDKRDALLFEFAFRGFLPRHIMPQLIVQRHTEIIEPYVWQRGVLLNSQSQQAQALIQVDYHDRVLTLWVKGEDAKDYLTILRDETLAILKLLDLNVEQYVALPAAARISSQGLSLSETEKAPFKQLEAHIKAGKTEFIAESGAVYDVAKIFNILMPAVGKKVNAMNVLWVCALKDEFDELLKVTEGITGWQENTEADGWKVATTQLHTQHGRKLSLKATYSDRMGGDAVAARTAVLMATGEYCCVVMSGICAGRRGEVSLGDVVFAERVWKYDSGKIKVEDGEQRFQGDMLQYRPRPIWVQRMQGLKLQNANFINARPELPLEHQEDWVLQQLQAGNNPVATDMAALRKQHCPDWQAVLKRLRSKQLIEEKGLILTAHGVEYIEELLLNYPDGMPEPAAFKIHVAPMATGSAVTEDPSIFPRLSQSMRKVVAVEMEGSAMAALAEVHDVPVILAKGVSDYGDLFKDDRYRHFAARASAECVMALLRESGDLLGG